jgi:hypothetical protein
VDRAVCDCVLGVADGGDPARHRRLRTCQKDLMPKQFIAGMFCFRNKKIRRRTRIEAAQKIF